MVTQIRDEQGWLITGSLALLAVIAVGFSLSYTQAVLIPFVIAVFVVSVVSPLVDYQVLSLRLPRGVAVLIAMLFVVVMLFVFGMVVFDALHRILSSVSEYSESMKGLFESLRTNLEKWNIHFGSKDWLEEKFSSEVPRWATSFAGGLTGFVSRSLLVFIFVGFLLAGRSSRAVQTGVYADIDTQIRKYIGTKLLVSGVTGVLVWISLRLLGLQLASVFGLLAFMLNFVPSVGSIIATLLPLPIAVAQFSDNPWMIVAVVVIPGAIQMGIGNIIEPKLMGSGLKLHPVTILLSLAFWGLLWGPVGMLLAVPMTACVRIVLDRFTITRPAGLALAGILPGMQQDSGSNQVV